MILQPIDYVVYAWLAIALLRAHFESSVIQWYILPGKSVTAYAINRQVPGPRLDLQEGDHVRIRYTTSS